MRRPVEFAQYTSVALEATLLRASTWELLGDMRRTKEFAQEITPLDGSSAWHALVANLLGSSARWFGEDADAVELPAQAARLGRRQNPVVAVYAYGQLALIAGDRAKWQECAVNVEAAFDVINEAGLEEYWMGSLAHIAKGRLLRHQRRLLESEAELARAVSLARRGIGVVELAYALVTLADMRRELDDRGSARELVREAGELIATAPEPGTLVPLLLEQTERAVRPALHTQGERSL